MMTWQIDTLPRPQTCVTAVISYARYIAGSRAELKHGHASPRELADADDPGHGGHRQLAKGVEVRRSARKAMRWYKKAVDQVHSSHHGNAAIVNEVAWTLAVTDQKGLQKPGYAQAIMDEMMSSNKQVQNHPEYLDTWAATYAANGNFPKAIELQKRALYFARTQERNDVIDILQTHLESLEAGANITDDIPSSAVLALLKTQPPLLDVRAPAEYRQSKLLNSFNAPY